MKTKERQDLIANLRDVGLNRGDAIELANSILWEINYRALQSEGKFDRKREIAVRVAEVTYPW